MQPGFQRLAEATDGAAAKRPRMVMRIDQRRHDDHIFRFIPSSTNACDATFFDGDAKLRLPTCRIQAFGRIDHAHRFSPEIQFGLAVGCDKAGSACGEAGRLTGFIQYALPYAHRRYWGKIAIWRADHAQGSGRSPWHDITKPRSGLTFP
jgi:hypothetical protein